MEEDYQVRCTNCYWIGKESDLVLSVDSNGIPEYSCPKCFSTEEYLIDIETSPH